MVAVHQWATALTHPIRRVERVDVQAIGVELRRLQAERAAALRAVATGQRGGARRWLAAATRYDRALVEAAELVGIPAPRQPKVRRLLGTHARLALEADLEEAGLELGCDLAA